MCITEIWTHHECGCQYLDPIPCYDRGLLSPNRSSERPENWALVSHPSSSSISSVCGKDAVAEAHELTSISPAREGAFESEDETEAAYNHRLHLVRICSIRQTVTKTFLEPICDDCVLLELGLVPETSSHHRRSNGSERDERNLDGAEWLLESSVEITVEPPADDDGFSRAHSKPRTSCSPPEYESEDETPRRGRGRRRAMEITRQSLAIDEGSPVGRRDSFQRLKQTGQYLRKARKRHDLKNPSIHRPSLSTSSSARSSSWIGHLKSDVGQRVRRKRPDMGPEVASNHDTESSYDASSSATEDDRILSLPSIPATASPTFSTNSINPEESIILALDQIISSSEFDSSYLSNTRPSDANQAETVRPERRDPARPSTSSSRSAKSFETATPTVSPSSSPVAGLAGSGADIGISLHPLSCPLLTSTCSEDGLISEVATQEEKGEDDKDRAGSIKKEGDHRRRRGGNLHLMGELVEAGMGVSWAVPRSASC